MEPRDYDAKGKTALVALLGCGDFREMCKRDMVRVEAWAASRMWTNAKWNLSSSWEHANLVRRLVEPQMGHNHCREALSAALRLTAFYGEGGAARQPSSASATGSTSRSSQRAWGGT